jgi:DNA-binding beta-propeller fold protein YncE
MRDVDGAIKEGLDRSLRTIEPPPLRVDEVMMRGRRLRRRRAIVAVACSLAVVVAVGAPLLFLAPLGDQGTGTGTEPGALTVEAEIHLEPGLTDVAFGSGSVWVTGTAGVVEVDAATNRVLARVTVAGTGDHSRIAIGEGAVWVTAPELRDDGSRGNLVRIDPATAEVEATYEIGHTITGVATGDGSVWLTIAGKGPGELLRIDRSTGRMLGRVRVVESPFSPIYAEGFVWVPGPDLVTKVDPETMTVIDEFAVPNIQAFGTGSLWGVGNDAVMRVDPESGEITATIRVPRAVAVSVDGSTVWVLVEARSSDPVLFEPIPGTAAVARIDPATNEVIGEPLRLAGLQLIALSGDADDVWVADYDSGTLTKIRTEAVR